MLNHGASKTTVQHNAVPLPGRIKDFGLSLSSNATERKGLQADIHSFTCEGQGVNHVFSSPFEQLLVEKYRGFTPNPSFRNCTLSIAPFLCSSELKCQDYNQKKGKTPRRQPAVLKWVRACVCVRTMGVSKRACVSPSSGRVHEDDVSARMVPFGFFPSLTHRVRCMRVCFLAAHVERMDTEASRDLSSCLCRA
jgi:hypothetical protein